MSKLEDTVRRLLEGAAPEPPAGSGPAQTPAARRRRSSAPLWAAAVILGLAALLFGRHATDSTKPSASHPAAPSSTYPHTTIATPAVGHKLVGYYGISISVPTSWRVQPVLCDFFPSTDSVIPQTGEHASCPMQTSPHNQPESAYTTVTLGTRDSAQHSLASTPTKIDGVAATTGMIAADHGFTGVVIVPSRDVAVSVQAPTRAKVQAVLDTVHIAPIDANGCRDKVAPLSASSNPKSTTLVPGTPTSLTVCEYNASGKTYRLLGSRALTAKNATGYARLLNQGTPATSPLTTPQPVLARYMFGYSDGTTRWIDISLDEQESTVTDGRQTVVVSFPDNAPARAFLP